MENVELKVPTEQDYNKAEELFELYQNGAENKYEELIAKFDWEPIVFEENGLKGLKTAYDKVLIPAMVDEFYILSRSFHRFADKLTVVIDNKYGIIETDGSGDWIVEPEYDYIGFPNIITHVKKGDKWGLLNIRDNKLVVSLDYDSMSNNNGFFFLNGIGVLVKGDKIAIAMEKGDVSKAIFDEIEQPVEGEVKVKMNGEWGYINEEGGFTSNIDDAYYFGGVDL